MNSLSSDTDVGRTSDMNLILIFLFLIAYSEPFQKLLKDRLIKDEFVPFSWQVKKIFKCQKFFDRIMDDMEQFFEQFFDRIMNDKRLICHQLKVGE